MHCQHIPCHADCSLHGTHWCALLAVCCACDNQALIKARGDGVAFEPLSRIHVQLPMLTPTSSSDVQPHQAVQPTQAVQPLQPAQAVPPVQAAPPIQPVQAVQLVVDGRPQPRWRAYLQQLPHRHWVAVVRAPPECVVDAAGVRRRWRLAGPMPAQSQPCMCHAGAAPLALLTHSLTTLLPCSKQTQVTCPFVALRC